MALRLVTNVTESQSSENTVVLWCAALCCAALCSAWHWDMHWVLTESWLTPDQLSENHPGLWNKSEEREDWFISQDWSQTTTGSGGWIKKRVDRKLHKNSDLTSAGPQFWKLFELSDPVFIAQDANELTMWTNIKGKQKSEQNFFVIIWNKQTLRISKKHTETQWEGEKEKDRVNYNYTSDQCRILSWDVFKAISREKN